MTKERMIQILSEHSIKWKVENGKLWAYEVMTLNGKNCSKWVLCQPEDKTVNNCNIWIWLGY